MQNKKTFPLAENFIFNIFIIDNNTVLLYTYLSCFKQHKYNYNTSTISLQVIILRHEIYVLKLP